MKTNVSIKFNSLDEYREIKSKLIELGYKSNIFSLCEEDLRPNKEYRFNIESNGLFKVTKSNFYNLQEHSLNDFFK